MLMTISTTLQNPPECVLKGTPPTGCMKPVNTM
jgi:hypothetical protein